MCMYLYVYVGVCVQCIKLCIILCGRVCVCVLLHRFDFEYIGGVPSAYSFYLGGESQSVTYCYGYIIVIIIFMLL